MKTQYVLGVDGGNTKTDYYLFTSGGVFADKLTAGTCSHEALAGGFDAAKKEMSERIPELLNRNKITVKDIGFAVFGLAGADFDFQKEKLREIVRSIGFTRFILDNDGFLALMAGSTDGYGIACICGTGTVVSGVNKDGGRLQIGGLDELSGDSGGGGYLAVRTAKAVYETLFRCGKKTVLCEAVFKAFNIKSDSDFALAASRALESKDGVLTLCKILAEAEKSGDEAALEILTYSAEGMARSVAGCYKRLGFSGPAEIVLAGSIWTKAGFATLNSVFTKNLARLCGCEQNIIITALPPAAGAVIWALGSGGYMAFNEARKALETYRDKLI